MRPATARVLGSHRASQNPHVEVAHRATAIAIERWITLTRVSLKNRQAWSEVEPVLMNGEFDKARELYLDQWLGFSEIQLHDQLEAAGFKQIDIRVVSREKQSPHFQTVFATGVK